MNTRLNTAAANVCSCATLSNTLLHISGIFRADYAAVLCLHTHTQSDSALFNLSLLTSDLYGLLFAYFIEGKRLSWLYFVSFAVIVRYQRYTTKQRH
jgi:Solute carrier family 35